VWLNNPRKPLEASGTSGMKASMNGVPHLSIGDGWWAEGYNRKNGWLIEANRAPTIRLGRRAGRRSALHAARDRGRARLLRSRRQRHPHRWLQVVREAILSVAPRFSARRMVKQYAETMYGPVSRQLTESR
jgi:starch phosphorylase